MAKVLVEEENLQNIADTIRAKNKSSETYYPRQMASAIAELSNLPDVTPSDEGKVLAVDSNGEWAAEHPVIVSGTDTQVNNAVADYLDTEGVTSPTVTVSEITNGHRLTITDIDHPQGQSIDVMDGADGLPSAAKVLLITILRNALYKTDQSANITALEAAIDAPRDNITLANGVLTILALANDPVQSGAALTIS